MVKERVCFECRSTNVRIERRPFDADFGLDNPVTLEDVEHLVCGNCQEVSVIMRPAQTTRAIVDAIVSSDVALTPKEVAFLRHATGMSQGTLGKMIGISQEHLSRCECGKTSLGSTAERLLRLLAISKVNVAGDTVSKALDHSIERTVPADEHRWRIPVDTSP